MENGDVITYRIEQIRELVADGTYDLGDLLDIIRDQQDTIESLESELANSVPMDGT